MEYAKRIIVKGIVQGVGFRPFVYKLAIEYSLKGFVANNSRGVIIEVEGSRQALDNFIKHMENRPPMGAKIKEIICEDIPKRDFKTFVISPSQKQDKKEAFIPPDIATCFDCIKELFDIRDRRFRYPFTNCTNCGPRYTIIKDIPYDRPATTMNKFPMCDKCRGEYDNPLDRRFHAQPNACPACGPSIEILDREGNKLNPSDPFRFIAERIKEGATLVLKGLGGFHLVCDARNDTAVEKVRILKRRRDKPLAVMVPSMEHARKLVILTEKDEEILNGPEAPIVIAEKKENADISTLIAPRLNEIGIMLPYTPLHHILLKEFDGPLVMTSGNPRGSPIICRNEEATATFNSTVDYFLLHNRDIHIRIDDSVVRTVKNSVQILRRARGYTPFPVDTGFKSSKTVLALGGMLKATFTFLRGDGAIMSQYIGDLSNAENLDFYLQVLEHIRKLYNFRPDVIVCDLHPDYPTTTIGEELCSRFNCRLIRVQHHISHLASAAAEHKFYKNFIGISFDGTGYGLDKNIWGGEVFWGTITGLQRMAHIDYFPLPTGDKGIEEPWRITISFLLHILKDKISENEWVITHKKHLPVESFLKVLTSLKHPMTSSAGRLLDSVASLLNIRHRITYEGQAAIELEAIASSHEDSFYSDPIIQDGLNFNPYALIEAVLSDQKRGVNVDIISARVHNTLARWISRIASIIREEKETNHVVLSGGVFQNKYLLGKTLKLLEEDNFKVIFNSVIPINDGGISFGQAIIGAMESK